SPTKPAWTGAGGRLRRGLRRCPGPQRTSRPPRGGGGQFDDMLKKQCPYHKGPVNHTLEQCEMLKKYYNRVVHHDEDKKKDAGDKGGDDEFPPVENAFFIFGGATTNMTSRQCKRERREVFSVTKATPSYLDWSKDTITFGREDHPDYVPHPGRYPLVVDPIIRQHPLLQGAHGRRQRPQH